MNDPLASVPKAGTRRLALRATPAALRSLRAGRPWIFADAIEKRSFDAAPGDVAVVFDDKERVAAVGLWDPDGPIVFRALAHGAAMVDDGFFAAKIAEAVARRAEIAALHEGYRVVYGEADGLGGLVVDSYADVLVVKIYTSAWIPRLKAVVPALERLLAPSRIVLRTTRNVAALPARLHGLADGAMLRGDAPTSAVEFREHGILFGADVVRGQKTGFFLDQRENRRKVESLSKGRRVLNVCSYSGGFSLYAARGGAVSVASLDVSAAALAEAEANFRRNADLPGVAACSHEILRGDAFELLPALAREGRRFDLVVLDPPAFAKRSDEVERALAAYARLVRGGLSTLAPGGVLVACSCSSRVTSAAFFDAVRSAAASAGRPLRTLAETGQPDDHPTTPETTYLKALFAEA